jgi:hypothetical protein
MLPEEASEVTHGNERVCTILTEREPSRMFVRCSHLNVSLFSARVSWTVPIFSGNPSGDQAMFVSGRP